MIAVDGVAGVTRWVTEANWPAALDDAHAATLRVALRDILDACVHFAAGDSP